MNKKVVSKKPSVRRSLNRFSKEDRDRMSSPATDTTDPAYRNDLRRLALAVHKKHQGNLDMCYLARQVWLLLDLK